MAKASHETVTPWSVWWSSTCSASIGHFRQGKQHANCTWKSKRYGPKILKDEVADMEVIYLPPVVTTPQKSQNETWLSYAKLRARYKHPQIMVQWKVPTFYFLTAPYCCRNPIISHYIPFNIPSNIRSINNIYSSFSHLFFMEKRRNKHPLCPRSRFPLPSPQIRGEQRRRRGGQRLRGPRLVASAEVGRHAATPGGALHVPW